MTVDSYICRFIEAHPNDWMALMKEKQIRVKTEGRLALFKYAAGCDFFDPVVQEARGIIIDTEAREVVCWPFRKFGNYNEGYADPIDWSGARVLEKIDGSIIKLWYDHERAKWQFSSSGTIRAEEAFLDSAPGLSFQVLIESAENVSDIPYDRLHRDRTYLFELVSPHQRIVIRYAHTKLYHIGTRSNRTGEEFDEDIGVEKPRAFPLSTFEDCLAAVLQLNRASGENEVEKEGYVVVDRNFHRIKIKSPDYIVMHHLTQSRHVSKKDCVNALLHDPAMVERILEASPDLVPLVKFYDYQLAYLFWQADQMGELSINLLREYDGDMGALAGIIKRHPLSDVGFRCARTGTCGRDVLLGFPQDKLLRLIPDYEPEDFKKLFRPDP